MNIEMETHAGITVETTTNEEQQKGWRKVLERLGGWLLYKDKNLWLEQMRGNLSLMATVIATMTFQMALNPPGGVRSIKDEANPPDSNTAYADAPSDSLHGVLSCTLGGYFYLHLCPGEAVLAVVYSDRYFVFLVSNTICFITSLSICLLLVSGIPLNHRFPIWLLVIGMCATLTSLAISYITALVLTTPDPIFEQASNFLVKLVFAWMILLVIIGLCHTLRFFIWVVKYFLKRSKKNKSIRSYSSIARQRVMN
ncbi:hypothetical protein P8452_68785 [Trifolium repens]|nr:hypothetical protein P8452_68785 [Trifolium repens]